MTDEALIKWLARRAMEGAEVLSLPERADLYQASAVVLTPVDTNAAEVARHTAMLLREADRHQLQFLGLLNP